MSAPVAFAPPAYDPVLTRDVLRHLWRPQTAAELAEGTGYRYVAVRGALFTLRSAGLAARRPVRGRRGVRWLWSRYPGSPQAADRP